MMFFIFSSPVFQDVSYRLRSTERGQSSKSKKRQTNALMILVFSWAFLKISKKQNNASRILHDPKRKPHSNIFSVCLDSSLLTDHLSSCVLQGHSVRKGQFNEFWKPWDCVWSNAYAATGAECLDYPEWHEAAETGGAAYDRAWRCLILRTKACSPYCRNEGQLFILSKRKFKPPWF